MIGAAQSADPHAQHDVAARRCRRRFRGFVFILVSLRRHSRSTSRVATPVAFLSARRGLSRPAPPVVISSSSGPTTMEDAVNLSSSCNGDADMFDPGALFLGPDPVPAGIEDGRSCHVAMVAGSDDRSHFPDASYTNAGGFLHGFLIEMQREMQHLLEENKNLEECLKIASEDQRVMNSTVKEIEEEHWKDLRRINLLENEVSRT
ncbi:hypothetical protein ZIOFF_032325 [Zingiber officinale]|uniref:Uncharacterized protein n=1 Tax=Zingiber officinale TaxID=94328 RepID=A0A8J5LBI4_ZINOF|nr:hypothetical protein ZIOFF_032325 [Zingiber officinale]